jgi:hypothetical protein
MDSRQQAILKTLLYADLFDYPLKREEIFKFLISEKKIAKQDIFSAIKNHNLPMQESDRFYYLTNRKGLVEIRKKREAISKQKLIIAKKIINNISNIPSVKLVGISGTLSMKNSDDDDDIDLFVVTDNGLSWITRLMIVIFLTVLGKYRNRNSKDHSNKICLNMILDEQHMDLGNVSKDLYTAHEIIQLMPIFNKDKTYEKFIEKNHWINEYLPNVKANRNVVSKKNSNFTKLINLFLRIMQFEKIAKFLQLSYMKNHKTSETIKDGFLKFHPYDYKSFVLNSFKKKFSKYLSKNVL